MDTSLVQIGGFAATLIGFGWGLIRFLLGKFDSITAKMSADIAALHQRVDTVRDQHVRREDYHRDLERSHDEMKMVRDRVTEGLDGVRMEMRAELREIAARLDKMLVGLTRGAAE